MQDGLYRIGEVSRITGISRDTLHFYDKIGLLTPEYVGPENRYRYYSRKNLWELDIITICRSLDLPLERIREILSLRDNGKIAGILMAYRQEALRRRDYYGRVAAARIRRGTGMAVSSQVSTSCRMISSHPAW